MAYLTKSPLKKPSADKYYWSPDERVGISSPDEVREVPPAKRPAGLGNGTESNTTIDMNLDKIEAGPIHPPFDPMIEEALIGSVPEISADTALLMPGQSPGTARDRNEKHQSNRPVFPNIDNVPTAQRDPPSTSNPAWGEDEAAGEELDQVPPVPTADEGQPKGWKKAKAATRKKSMFSVKGKWNPDSEGVVAGHSPWVLNPSSPFFRRWDIWVCFLLLYTAVITPFEVGFLKSKLDGLFVFNQLVNLSFLTDVFFNFFMPFEERGVVIQDLNVIQKRYLSFWFWIDVLSIAPFDVWGVLTNSQSTSNLKVVRIVRLLRLAKLARILRAGRMFQRFETAYAINYSQLSLAQFTVTIIFLAHWMACFWSVILDLQGDVTFDGEEINWVIGYAYLENHSSVLTKYVAALYWAIATLSTLGYGDVLPTTDWERGYVILCTMLGASVYAYTVGAVCSIFAAMDRQRNEFYSMMDKLNSFIDEQNLPTDLAAKLRSFFRYTYSQQGGASDADAQELWNKMSPSLRQDVAVGLHSRWIKAIPFFKGIDDDFMTMIAAQLDCRHYPPQENVVQVGERAETMYIVQKGVVACKGMILTRGKAFGTDMIYKDFRRTYSAVTFTNVTVLCLPREGIMCNLDEYPAIAKQLRLAATKVIFRDTVIAYAAAVRATIEEARGGKKAGSIDTLFAKDLLPMVFQHRLRVLVAENPTELKRLEVATRTIQKNLKRHVQTRKAKTLLRELQNLPPRAAEGAKVVVSLGMDAYIDPLKREDILDVDILAGLTPEAVYMCINSPKNREEQDSKKKQSDAQVVMGDLKMSMGSAYKLIQGAKDHIFHSTMSQTLLPSNSNMAVGGGGAMAANAIIKDPVRGPTPTSVVGGLDQFATQV